MGTVRSHKLVDLRFDSRQFVAVCRCGWKSPQCSSSGLAQSALDLHAEETVTNDVQGRKVCGS